MRSRTSSLVVAAGFVWFAQRAEPPAAVHVMPTTVIETAPTMPSYTRRGRAPTHGAPAALPVRKDFKDRVIASAGAL